jgi:hypothetical protein
VSIARRLVVGGWPGADAYARYGTRLMAILLPTLVYRTVRYELLELWKVKWLTISLLVVTYDLARAV